MLDMHVGMGQTRGSEVEAYNGAHTVPTITWNQV